MARACVALALICLLLAGCSAAPPGALCGDEIILAAADEGGPKAGDVSDGETPLLQCLYYERDGFLAGCGAAPPYTGAGRLVAGMVPHHLVAGDMISGFFALAAAQPEGYDRVVILAPSHYPEQCGSAVVTAIADWETPYGTVRAGRAAAEALLADARLAAADDPAAAEFDHGVAGLVPYVAHYLPGTEVTVCLVSNRVGPEKQAALQEVLAGLCADGRTLLVASVDCSHYLRAEEAAPMDTETAAAIEGFDYAAIAGFDDSHIDSPQAVAAFLSTAQQMEAALVQLGHATSEDKLPQARSNQIYAEGITTYFVYGAFVA